MKLKFLNINNSLLNFDYKIKHIILWKFQVSTLPTYYVTEDTAFLSDEPPNNGALVIDSRWHALGTKA